jgi:hypothetical protein
LDKELRNETRAQKRFKVEYLVETGFGSKGLIRTNTTNISTTGMRLGASRRLPDSQKRIECRIFFDDRIVILEAEIIWRQDTLMGVRFLDSSAELKLAIAISLGKRMTHHFAPVDVPTLPKTLSSRAVVHKAPAPAPRPAQNKPLSPEFPDLSEKWLSRIKRGEDPHEKWINRRSF